MKYRKLYKMLKKYWILFVVFFSITIFTFITLTNVLGYSKNLIENDQVYSENAVELSIRNSHEKIDLRGLIDFLNQNGDGFLSSALGPKLNNEFTVYGLYKGEGNKIKIPLTSGKDISNKDYVSKERVALLKDNILNLLKETDSIKEIDGEEYFKYCGQLYKIIGIMDSKKSDNFRDIYINIYSILDNENFSIKPEGYVFVYDSGKGTKENIKELANKYPDVELKMDELMKGQKALLASVGINRIYIIGTVLLIIVSILTVINITSYWIEAEKKEFGIRKLIGARNSQLILLLLYRYIIIAACAIIFGFSCFEILKVVGTLKEFIISKTSLAIDVLSMLVLTFIILLIVLIVLIKPVKKICMLQINTIIRGEE